MDNAMEPIQPDIPGPGEKRLEPVEVDVIDNLLNAQAAYLEAIAVAGDHFGLRLDDDIATEITKKLAFPIGFIMSGVAARRV
ncbi:hypothetical protein [Mesorhizobium sp. B2-8-3]|uniref:hypothetical protein n=1 Tax=Mesorhizobium sp. B2-8-3 TaxID=2589905 RepID=UPI00112B8B3B|nr:hypothetical protein [Mesorhizobium sp. B2-8-3]TPJ33665.1 hypothetical protein FJ418_13630 [Mesorhizobium sp. B2-8-3]